MKVSILKYDPSVDAAPHYDDYEVEWREDMTLLEVLVAVDEGCEPLSHDYSCRGRVCGRCSMMLNGEPVNACWTVVKDESLTIEPLEGFSVVRDLVVDKSRQLEQIRHIDGRVWVEPVTDRSTIMADMDPELGKKINGLERCARCLCCLAGCPAFNLAGSDYIGPAGMVALAYRHFDPYDQGDRVLEAVSGGMYSCILCGKCDEVCPADEIDHLSIYQLLREEAESRGLKPSSAK